jgi:hypothetical protein
VIEFFHTNSSHAYSKLLLHPAVKNIDATMLYPFHFKINQVINKFDAPLFKVLKNPKNPKKWGLKNMTNETVEVHLEDGSSKSVEHGKVIPIKSGFSFIINNKIAKIL